MVADNDFNANRTGIALLDEDLVGSSDVAVEHNRFLANRTGIQVFARVAVARARIADNQLDENDGPGIQVDVFCFLGFPSCGGEGMVIERNHARRNGFAAGAPGDGDGIRVRGQDDDAQPIDPAWITLSGNESDRNADLGIDAPGVSDGGKNRAKFNGDPQQCVGVDCGVPAGKKAPKKKKDKTRDGAHTRAQAAAQAASPAAADALSSLLATLPRH